MAAARLVERFGSADEDKLKKKLLAADLFCGAGGSSTGLLMAAALLDRKVELTAINHWDRAVETHAANHPKANHFCEELTTLDPKKAIPAGKLDLLIASPECTHHSVARGGKPMNDQSRASAWCVLRWATTLRVDRILIENVREFVTWGPIGSNGRPLKSRRGETFAAFVNSLESLGYRVEWRFLNAADYGDATTRQRLFLQAALGKRPIRWPSPSHSRDQTPGLFGSLKPWRAAREVIDWRLVGGSIFNRKQPLSENTLERIRAGLRKFGGQNAEPFLLAMNYMSSREKDARHNHSVNKPIPTITAGGNHFGLVEPFLMSAGGPKVDARSINRPVNTVLTRDHMALVDPFIVGAGGPRGQGSPQSVGDPLGTVTTENHRALVEPFLMHTTHHGGDRVNSVDGPVPTVTGANRGEQALVQPFILPHRKFDRMDVDSIDKPMRTIDASNGGCNALVEPFITSFKEGIERRVHSVDQPLPTQTTEKQFGLAQPFVVPYYRTGVPDSIDEPLPTITTRDRLGLVEPDAVAIDIRFRMLAPHELAGAMGFPADYKFTGNRGEQVKQIGNAVAVNQVAALCREMIGERE